MTDRNAQLKKNARRRLSARYLTALRTHLGSQDSGNGDTAQRLGRAAVAAGLASLDLAAMHDRAVVALAESHDFPKSLHGWFRRKGYFFNQALIPMEAAQRATREANWRLRHRHEILRRHAVALLRVNRRLQREITRRRAGEAAIKKGKEQYRALFLESQDMQRRLRQLTRQIILVQEQERKEISRELHDGVVQTLVGINVELSALGRGASAGLDTLKEKIARAQRMVANSVNVVHRFARELRPAVLDDLGLIPALDAYSKGLAERKKIKIQLTAFDGVEALGSDERTALFRVAQEALTNVARHAHATRVRMSLSKISDTIRMEISDNGTAFDVREVLRAKNPKRLGLVGMRERVEMVGGTLTIVSTTGKGTTVRAEVPLRRERTEP